jgi:hypothetical protein
MSSALERATGGGGPCTSGVGIKGGQVVNVSKVAGSNGELGVTADAVVAVYVQGELRLGLGLVRKCTMISSMLLFSEAV